MSFVSFCLSTYKNMKRKYKNIKRNIKDVLREKMIEKWIFYEYIKFHVKKYQTEMQNLVKYSLYDNMISIYVEL